MSESNAESIPPPEEFKPWFTLWTRPRETIRQIVNTDPNKYILLIAILSGVLSGAEMVVAKGLKDQIGLFDWIAHILFGALISVLFLQFLSYLTRRVGLWFDGRGQFQEIRATIAWTYIPTSAGTCLSLISMLLLREQVDLFTISELQSILSESALFGIAGIVLSAAKAAVWIWAWGISIVMLSEVQGFSVWKAFLNSFLSSAIILLLVFLLVALFSIAFLGSRLFDAFFTTSG